MQTTSQPAASARACTADAIEALLNRAKNLLLIGAWLGNPETVAFAKGSISALRSLRGGVGEKAAAKDASMGGYQPAADLQAAWAGLPVDIECSSFAEVQEFLRTQGLQVPLDTVAHSDLNAVEQLKDAPVTIVDVDDEHGATRAQLNDGTGAHGRLSVEVVDAEVQRTGIVTSCGGAA